jgi:hypothetical protein
MRWTWNLTEDAILMTGLSRSVHGITAIRRAIEKVATDLNDSAEAGLANVQTSREMSHDTVIRFNVRTVSDAAPTIAVMPAVETTCRLAHGCGAVTS